MTAARQTGRAPPGRAQRSACRQCQVHRSCPVNSCPRCAGHSSISMKRHLPMKAVRCGGLEASSLGKDFTLPFPRLQRLRGRKPSDPWRGCSNCGGGGQGGASRVRLRSACRCWVELSSGRHLVVQAASCAPHGGCLNVRVPSACAVYPLFGPVPPVQHGRVRHDALPSAPKRLPAAICCYP